MATSDDRRAAVLLLGLALAGVLVRFLVAGAAPPGGVGFRAAPTERPERDSVEARASRLARPLAPDERIDVDRATAEELTRLPRIGAGLASRIVADRDMRGPFGSLEELGRVSGVGPVLLETVQRNVTFSGRARRSREESDVHRSLSLNGASAEELAQLPGIGPVRAEAIVADRRRRGPFRRIEDLERVPGIGSATVERLRGRLRVP